MIGVWLLGFRHGFDPDHVAAITDISGSQPTRRRALGYSTL
jgi:high-affinity nickel permease